MAWLTVLGIPAAVYVASMTALMFYMNEKQQQPLLLLGAGTLTVAIYIFHRTSIVHIEPMQARHRLAIRHKKVFRMVSFLTLVLSVALFSMQHPIWELLVFCSIAGVIVYGRNVISKPLRNITYLKPFMVGTAIAMFAWALNEFSNLGLSPVLFILICSADALVCDVVDCAYDSASGCTTLASKYGVFGTWLIAGLLYVIAAIVFQSYVGWLFLLMFPVPLLFQKFMRTAVDIRPLLVLLLAWSL